MIKIHRSKPVARVGDRSVPLTAAQHQLLISLGMMDNKLVSHQLLLEIMAEGRVQIPADKFVVQQHMSRLRKKIGPDRLQCRRQRGYILVGQVNFYG
jgi:DNA-binding response OmpR family regulator